jgi:hypothetical protein
MQAQSTMKILSEWLTERVESAPTSYDRSLPDRAALRIRMAWQKLKQQAGDGDEVWAFSNPSNMWKKQGRLTGYALVREGEIVDTVTVPSRD